MLFSESMARTVTTVPAKTPSRHLKNAICQSVWLIPKSPVAILRPKSDTIRTGFLPYRSEAWPALLVMHFDFKSKSKKKETHLPPKNHHAHLCRTEQTLNQARVESYVLLLHAPHRLNHEIDIRKDGEERDGCHATRVAE